jgi:serine/threonine protein phosphatase PrpC
MPDQFRVQDETTGKLEADVTTAQRPGEMICTSYEPGPRRRATSPQSAIRLTPFDNAPLQVAVPQQWEHCTEPLAVPHISDSAGQRGMDVREKTEPVMSTVRLPLQESSIRLEVGSASDPGIKRKDDPNEDSILSIQGTRIHHARSHPFGLFIVADGMGGHANGQEASRLVIKALSDAVIPAMLNNAEDEKIFVALLAEEINHAALALYQHNRQQQSFMGTTMTAALVVGSTAHIANVGDSRTYLYRQGELSQLTRDHSVVARLVEEKVITRDDIYTHPRRNEIYRCLGAHASVQVDSFTLSLQPGDSLLLCSDGLWEMVRDPEIRHILNYAAHQPSLASALLIQAALDAGGQDNVSVILVHVPTSI